MTVSLGTLVIDTEACKGCELCIDACPPRVLRMTDDIVNERGYRYPQLLPGCIACKACTAICPDFVFQVYRYDEPQDDGRPAGGQDADGRPADGQGADGQGGGDQGGGDQATGDGSGA